MEQPIAKPRPSYAIVLAYDGTRFEGWQLQPQRRTVQGVVEEALSKIHGVTRVAIVGAGRTDAGVHALGQVASYTPPTPREPAQLQHALSRLLSHEVRPLSVRAMSNQFHACRSAAGKIYRYRVVNRPTLLPFEAPYVWHVPQRLEIGAMLAAAATLPGTRDFASFSAAGGQTKSYVRELRRLAIVPRDDGEISIEVEADGFLYRMVRIITGLLIEIGRARRSTEAVAALLAAPRVGSAATMAPPQGLCLVRVHYPRDDDPHSVS
ncbi:MAG: tRNA pseudouridine(38-40) synthase TruA [Acidobacteriota bacterium]